MTEPPQREYHPIEGGRGCLPLVVVVMMICITVILKAWIEAGC